MKEIVEVMQLVRQECIQHQEQQVVGETSQIIVDIPTVQDQVIIQEIPEVQVVERIQEQIKDSIKSCSRGASATAHRRTNCGRHRAAQDYAENTCVLFDEFYGENAETLTTAVKSSKLFVDGRSECFAEKLPRSTKRLSRMSEEEVECYVKEFERAGGDPRSEQWMDSDHV